MFIKLISQNMNILITGGAGFIGSNLCENLLLNTDNNICCIDNFNDKYDPSIKRENIKDFGSSTNYTIYEGDILDTSFLKQVFESNSFDVIIHLAAMTGVRASIEDPTTYFNVNVQGTLNILEMMKSYNINKMIFASSSSLYGNNKKVPFSEQDNVDYPISPYAASKKAGELLCYTYHHLYNFNITCLRFFTVYGPKQRPDLAIYKFTKALFDDKPIDMFGDGFTFRDYTHVDDIVQGIVNSMDRISSYNIYNLGESKTISLIELIHLLEMYTEKTAKINFLPLKAGDVLQTYANIDKAKAHLGYSPKITLEQGLNEFVNWYKSNVLNENISFFN